MAKANIDIKHIELSSSTTPSEEALSVQFPDGKVLAIWSDGWYQLWTPGVMLSEGLLWSELPSRVLPQGAI